MKRFFFNPQSFTARLVLGVVILVLVTALSTGAPAYWLARTQLERQAWSQVANAQQATSSLLLAEQSKLQSLALLVAERPTLQQLVTEQATSELSAYLADFRKQSELDLLWFCANGGAVAGGQPLLEQCPPPGTPAIALVSGRPALLASSMVVVESTADVLGIATAGQWLDDAFLQQLARNTSLEYSILTSDGSVLASSLAATAEGSARQPLAVNSQTLGRQTIGAHHYFVNYLPLQAGNEENLLSIEVALPVDDLIATENQALAVLVISTGLVALAGMVVATLFIRRMTRPLGQLTMIAREIALGNFIAPIPSFSGPVEVATLASALQRSHAAMRQALNELAQARDWLNNLVQSIVEGVILCDPGGRVTFFSQGAEGLLGWSSSEAIGRPFNDLVQTAEGSPLHEQTPPAGQQRQWEVMARANRPLTLAVTSARLAPLNGEPAQTALVLRDITEEEAGRHLRAYFLASITHEFRTPLSTLSASLELLLAEDEALSAAEMRELLKPSYLSLLTLQTLVDNLLESSKIEAGRFTIRRQPMTFDPVIASAARIVRPLLERRHHELHIHGIDSLPPIEADAAHLTQVVVNLLTNAAKYSPLEEDIDLCGELLADRVRIVVADRGAGIPAHERVQLFRRFVRLDDQTAEQYGSGLGLYVVKTTIEAHGGHVGVEERPGGGSLFWFELPLSVEPGEPN